MDTGHTLGREVDAQRLLLGHLSARYYDFTPLETEAKAVFPAAEVAEELRRYELDPWEKEPGLDRNKRET